MSVGGRIAFSGARAFEREVLNLLALATGTTPLDVAVFEQSERDEGGWQLVDRQWGTRSHGMRSESRLIESSQGIHGEETSYTLSGLPPGATVKAASWLDMRTGGRLTVACEGFSAPTMDVIRRTFGTIAAEAAR